MQINTDYYFTLSLRSQINNEIINKPQNIMYAI